MKEKTKIQISFSEDNFRYTTKPIKGWRHIAIDKVWLNNNGDIVFAKEICYFHFCKGMRLFDKR